MKIAVKLQIYLTVNSTVTQNKIASYIQFVATTLYRWSIGHTIYINCNCITLQYFPFVSPM